MTMYNTIAENPQSTVVAEYAAEYRTAKAYQSEAELERAFIDQLQSQAYEYLSITTEADLVLPEPIEQTNTEEVSSQSIDDIINAEIAAMGETSSNWLDEL